jgi:hypothetical protein
MTKYYRDYCWIDAIPYGIDPLEEIATMDTYKIVMDPYRKRISIEKYSRGQFSTTIYDSYLLDFRHLKKPEQTSWQKLPIVEKPEQTICLIRDQDDRVLFLETHLFAKDLCRECRVSSPHSIPLSVHRMFYTELKDPFDGVILYDSNDHPVMMKRYEFDVGLRQFTTLLEEQWDLHAENKVPEK